MTQILYGERLGKEGSIRLGCSAVIYDPGRQKVLLTRRRDNGQWCLPSGAVDPGESVSEACQREVLEETGLTVQVLRLTGVYSDPHQLVIYPDGNKVQIVALNFEAELLSGEPTLSDETTGIGFFSSEEMEKLVVISNHLQRIQDTLDGKDAAFIN
jgi:8-oxo-dGTP pyrophosphatase MutT (NUDIX family)